MGLFDLGRMLHSTIGVAALVAFWVAALALKGGRTHRRAGKIYLVSLLGVMTLSTLMVAGRAVEGDPGIAIFLGFLISMVGTASWLMWFSIQRRSEPERFLAGTYRGLAGWLMLAGAGLFLMGLARRLPLTMFLSLLGLGFGANMLRLARTGRREGHWWLDHHLNGVMLNFIATHDSFLALGVGSVVPELRQPLPRMLVAVGVTTVAITLRAWVGLRRRPMARGARAVPLGATAVPPLPRPPAG